MWLRTSYQWRSVCYTLSCTLYLSADAWHAILHFKCIWRRQDRRLKRSYHILWPAGLLSSVLQLFLYFGNNSRYVYRTIVNIYIYIYSQIMPVFDNLFVKTILYAITPPEIFKNSCRGAFCKEFSWKFPSKTFFFLKSAANSKTLLT